MSVLFDNDYQYTIIEDNLIKVYVKYLNDYETFSFDEIKSMSNEQLKEFLEKVTSASWMEGYFDA